MPSILLADSNLQLCDYLENFLSGESYHVYIANDGEKVMEILSEVSIDILLLDVMIPKINGLKIAQRVCKRFSTPILMFSSRSDEASVIEFFKAGADQYLPKPFKDTELLMRIQSLLRRVSLERTRYKYSTPSDDFEENISRLPFTNTEADIVNYLMKNKGKAISKKELQVSVLRRDFYEFDRNLDMHISNIRRKMTLSGYSKSVISTVRSEGYRFEIKQ